MSTHINNCPIPSYVKSPLSNVAQRLPARGEPREVAQNNDRWGLSGKKYTFAKHMFSHVRDDLFVGEVLY